ncbi:mechanosensitive ion channel family protein [Levyella massiliensis]|uniref:mechanosensitive ion channel family protein n=1 Tax=Levyella massiliensis TaxID=938289 RepID=UPI0003614FF6|nr:mechanosensitive ion channel domain-containing protein [Levyella massiliensis]
MALLAQKLHMLTGLPLLASRVLLAMAVLLFTWALLAAGSRLLHRFIEEGTDLPKKARFRTFYFLLYNVLRIVVWMYAIAFILDTFGIHTASVLTAAGIGGIAIALGAQSVVNDVISGALLLLDNYMNVGDYVALKDGVVGEVQEIRLRHTIVRGYTGMRYMVPNSKVQVITNYGKGPLQADVTVEVPYSVSPETVKQLVQDVSHRIKTQHAKEFVTLPYFIGVDKSNALTYTVAVGARTDIKHFWSAARLVRALLIEALQKESACYEGTWPSVAIPATHTATTQETGVKKP